MGTCHHADMKFAVAGASGFVGSALVRRLEAERHEVLRLVRRPVERPGEVAWHPLSGEVEQRELLEGMEGLVNFAGSNLAAGRWTPERKEEILRSRVEGTRTLVAVLAHLNHKPRVFLSASAVGYYGARGEEELTEASAMGKGFLAEVCRAWEDEARIAESVGVRAVLLRLGLVLDRSGGVLAKLLPLFRTGFGGRLGDGRQWMSWITLDDLLEVLLLSLRDGRLTGPVNAVAPAPVRNAEFTAALAHALGRRAMVPMPSFLLRLIYQEMADETLLASTRVRPQRLVDAGFRFNHPTLNEALRAVLAGE
jgi:uncharacterized protein (TIGR01777 family)